MARATLQTDVGQLIGTLQYMSPEQCEADPHDLDTRSDVYALGVVLFELLCGKLPYDVTRLAVYEATRVVREQAPSRLSTLDARLHGDVETIVTKALEKDRERRYRSAAELADDLRRYLTGDAITARPPSMVYQLRVFARRNKPLVGGVAATFVALVIGVVVSTSLYYRSEAARASAVAARDKAEVVTKYLSDALASLDPEVARGRDVTLLREVLDDVACRIESEPAFADDSLAQANLRLTIGVTYGHLGLYDEAEPHLNAALETRRRVLGEENPETLKSADRLAYVLWRRGKFHEAEPLYRQTLEVRRKVLGADHPEVAESLLGLAMLLRETQDFAAAERYIRKGLKIARKTYGQEHAKVATMLDVWADLRRFRGDLGGGRATRPPGAGDAEKDSWVTTTWTSPRA